MKYHEALAAKMQEVTEARRKYLVQARELVSEMNPDVLRAIRDGQSAAARVAFNDEYGFNQED